MFFNSRQKKDIRAFKFNLNNEINYSLVDFLLCQCLYTAQQIIIIIICNYNFPFLLNCLLYLGCKFVRIIYTRTKLAIAKKIYKLHYKYIYIFFQVQNIAALINFVCASAIKLPYR